MKDFPAKYSFILGHEAVGVVESVGEHVNEVAAGDTVGPVFLAQCGECADCLSRRSNICSKLLPSFRAGLPRDGTTRFSLAATGEPVHRVLTISSFAEYTVVDVAHLVKVAAALPLAKACLLSCGVSTGVGAAWKVAAVDAGSTVAVFGLGTVGLARLGITDFVNPNDIGEKPVIKEMTGGGADYCFECVGAAPVMAEAFKSTRTGWGKTVILGSDGSAEPLRISSSDIKRGRSVHGALLGGIKPKDDVPVLAQQYLDKELQRDEFVTHELGFDEINGAFDLLVQGKSLSCIIGMDGARENGVRT